MTIETKLTIPNAQTEARQLGRGSQNLLRGAAECLGNAGANHNGRCAEKSIDHEAQIVTAFLRQESFWLAAAAVEARLNANPMKGGVEHRVGLLPRKNLVIKVANAQASAAESVFDYLTDLLLSNHCFGDDIKLLGGYELNAQLHLVITQPYLKGIHPDWPKLREGLTRQGLIDPYPGSETGAFEIQDEIVGTIDVHDLHTNNVILDNADRMHPIDAHFYFEDRPARIAALRRLDLIS